MSDFVKCFVCEALISYANILKHLKLIHNIDKNSNKFICVKTLCNKTFSSYDCYRKHLKCHISKNNNQSPKTIIIKKKKKISKNVNNELIFDERRRVDSCARSREEFQFQQEFEQHSALFSAKFYSDPILVRKTVQNIVNNTTELLNCTPLVSLKNQILSDYENMQASDTQKNRIVTLFHTLENPFANLDTEYLRIKHYKLYGGYVEPEEYIIGHKESMNKSGQLQILPLTATIVPLKDVLQSFFEMPDVLSTIEKYMIELLSQNNNIISNFVQCKLWQARVKNNNNDNALYLPMFSYYDEYDPNNPLASKKGLYKIGAFYTYLPCLPPYLASKLENIFLTMLVFSDDKKECTLINPFRKLVEMFSDLETNGIYVRKSTGEIVNIKIVMCLMLGDNLGLNDILGFVMNFSKSNYPCRLCKCHRDEISSMTVESECKLRNRDNYESDLLIADMSKTGIKTACIWNELNSFHVTENYVLDGMHDTLEGTCCYVFPVIISHLTSCKYISLTALNHKIQYFEYGPADKKNKPPIITVEQIESGYLKLSASEMLTLVRNFCVILGDVVPEKDQFWELCCIQREIVLLLLAKYVQLDLPSYLKHLVSRHHELYLKLSNKKLTIKFHNLLHASRIITMSGPPGFYTSMRFEGKHGEFKKYLSNVFCRLNTPKTASLKHQLVASYRYITNSGVKNEIIIGPGNICEPKQEVTCDVPSCLLPQCITTKKVDMFGYSYKPNSIIFLQFEEQSQLPVFGKVINFFCDKSKKLFVHYYVIKTIQFNNHLQSYEVTITNQTNILPLSSDFQYPPLVFNTASNGFKVVSLPFIL
jgi:hypothetical protein